MGLATIPTRTDGSVGRVKADTKAISDLNTQIVAADFNGVANAVVAVSTAVGLGDGSTPSSLEAARIPRLTEIGGPLSKLDRVAIADVSDTTDGAGGTAKSSTLQRVMDLILADVDPLRTFPSAGQLSIFLGKEDFMTGNVALSTLSPISSGTGASATGGATPPAGRLGVIAVTTGTTSTGYAGNISNTTQVPLGSGYFWCRCDLTVLNLSDGTDTYTLRVGLCDSSTGTDGTNAVMFRYTHSVNSGRWVCVTRAASVETTTSTTSTVVAGTYQRLEIQVNATATEVRFYIDGSLVATHTTNIPLGAAQATGLNAGTITKSLGTTARQANVDLYYWRYAMTTAL